LQKGPKLTLDSKKNHRLPNSSALSNTKEVLFYSVLLYCGSLKIIQVFIKHFYHIVKANAQALKNIFEFSL